MRTRNGPSTVEFVIDSRQIPLGEVLIDVPRPAPPSISISNPQPSIMAYRR